MTTGSTEPCNQLRVRTFAGLLVDRQSAETFGDGRYVFNIAAEERAAECADRLADGRVVKGHGADENGFFDVLLDDCTHCDRAKGRHLREGAEVGYWLSQMPEECRTFWFSNGCDGSGYIVIGGDRVQSYALDCPGCENCTPV